MSGYEEESLESSANRPPALQRSDLESKERASWIIWCSFKPALLAWAPGNACAACSFTRLVTHQVASVRAADRSGMTFVLMALLGYECMQPASDSLQPPRHEDASESLKRPLRLPQQLDSLPCFGLCWEIHACGCSTQALKPPWPALLLETTLPKLT